MIIAVDYSNLEKLNEESFDDRLKLFIEYSKIKKSLNEELQKAEKVLSTLMAPLLEDFADREIQNMNIAGVTVYVRIQKWAKITQPDDEDIDKLSLRANAVEALRSANLDEYITVETRGLSSHMRELEKNGEPFPEEFAGVIEFTEVPALVVRKS